MNSKPISLEGGVQNANSLQHAIDSMIMQGSQMNERLENFQRPNTYTDMQMNKAFENMNMTDNLININPDLERVWIHNQNNYNVNANVPQNFNNVEMINQTMQNQNVYGYNTMMQPHPMLLEFNKSLQQENLNEPKEKIDETKDTTEANDIYKDIIHVMENANENDDRMMNSNFLKFIKRLHEGDIKLNEKENNIDIVKDSGDKINSKYTVSDEQAMSDLWNKMENNLKDIDLNYDTESNPINIQKDKLILDNNPYLLTNEKSDLIELGKELMNTDIDKARYALEAETTKNPDNSEAWLLLGKLHTENDRDDLAMQCFLKALEVDPFNAEALLNLGISCTNEFDEFDAMVHLRNWIKLHHVYNKYFDNNNPLLDYEIIRFEIVNDRDDEDYYAKALRVEGLKKNFYKEMCNLMESIAINVPNDVDLWIALGIAHFIPHDNERAIECFRTAIKINPNDHNAWNKLGAILAHSGMNSEAINHYQKALALKPNYARCLANLGIAHFNVDNYDEAIRSFLRALKIFPKIDHVWSYIGSALLAAKQDQLYPLTHERNLNELLKIYKV